MLVLVVSRVVMIMSHGVEGAACRRRRHRRCRCYLLQLAAWCHCQR